MLRFNLNFFLIYSLFDLDSLCATFSIMDSLHELYRIGYGPSSSHTMGPHRAASQYRARHPDAVRYRVSLFGSLAATGKGHLTDVALVQAFHPVPVEVVWVPEQQLPLHPNGMLFEAIAADGAVSDPWEVYSFGGGAIGDRPISDAGSIYDLRSFNEIVARCERVGQAIWEYVEEREGAEIWEYLHEIWRVMREAIARGLETEGVLPGSLGVRRKAVSFHRKTLLSSRHLKIAGILSSYALAVSEENASGGLVVTAPTCGSAGVLPAVLRFLQETFHCSETSILHALATAGLIGNLIKHNASISGAQVGCQGEVGAACAMAAGAAAQLQGGTVRQVEYAASMALEHHLGLTCDPVAGLVQIPCIERNAFAANRAVNCADYALFTDGTHIISFDEVVAVLLETGSNMPSLYRETAEGGLAAAYRQRGGE
jgi:L-serine dehydratase